MPSHGISADPRRGAARGTHLRLARPQFRLGGRRLFQPRVRRFADFCRGGARSRYLGRGTRAELPAARRTPEPPVGGPVELRPLDPIQGHRPPVARRRVPRRHRGVGRAPPRPPHRQFPRGRGRPRRGTPVVRPPSGATLRGRGPLDRPDHGSRGCGRRSSRAIGCGPPARSSGMGFY